MAQKRARLSKSSNVITAEEFKRLSKKRNKFGAAKERCSSGVIHASTLEANRCSELHLLQKAGEISNLDAHPQPEWVFVVEGVHICSYRPDFRYFDKAGKMVVEDTKSKATMTDEYKIKKRLMKAQYGIDVIEIFRPPRRRKR